MVTAADDRSAAATLAKAAHENFPVAPRFLPRAWRDDLMAVYGYARLVDDIGDGDLPPGGADATLLGVDREHSDDRPALLDALAADLDRVFAAEGPTPRHPLLLALVPTVRRAGLTPEPFRALIEANRLDQRVRRYETQSQLLDYCELSANPVGRLVLAITGTATPERVRWSDAICTGLQLVEHVQDVTEDLARGRVYLPATAMRRFRVTEDDLTRPTANASVRTLVAYQTARARRLLDEGAPLVGSVHGRLRLLLAGFLGGGYAAAHAVARAGYDVLAGAPRASRGRLVYATATALRRRGT